MIRKSATTIRNTTTNKPLVKPHRKQNYAGLLKAIASVDEKMTGRAAAMVNQALVMRNWLVGAHLVEYEQDGSDRAKYGARLLKQLADDLMKRNVRGLDVRNLERCRVFYRTYPQIGTAIPATLSPELPVLLMLRNTKISATVSPKSATVGMRGKSGSLVQGKRAPDAPLPLTVDEVMRFPWSKLLELIGIDDPWKRAFFENECLKGHWSVRQLRRQIESLLYERTGLSINKRAVIERARRQSGNAPAESITELIRDPYVLEFTGLAERSEYAEDHLETALLDHLQRFLLELGAGFCFEARQFRVTEGNRHHRIDLVFYHRRLRCHILLDLKVRGFRPADAGQMNFYVNWFNANMMTDGDNPPVGIILCSGRKETEVEYAIGGMNNKLFVSRYLTALPPATHLKTLVDADRARFEQRRRKPRPKS